MKKLCLLVLAFLTVFVVAGCDKNTGVKGAYTYNYAASVFPTNWNPHTYQTATDADILGYTESGFYTFDYNETKDGYKIVPAMAKSEPVDVTAEYVGEQWGIAEGETGRAYKIDLKDNLEWEDGTPITAESFLNSAVRLLDPEADNYRADQLYAGSLVVANAKPYYYQGEIGLFPATTAYTVYSTDLDAELIFSLSEPNDDNNNAECALRTMMGFPASYDAEACAAYLIGNYLKGSAFTAEAAAAMEGKTLAEIKADATLKAAWEAILGWWQTEPNVELHFFIANYTWPEVDFENVGIKTTEDGDLVLILEKSLEGFYLLYNLTGSWLVHEETYDACIETTADGLYNNTYGTSVETFKSYGPYKLTYFQMDKEYRFTKNENWYGYDEEENAGLYQTTDIVCKFMAEAATRLQEFEKGNLDSYGLTASDMDEYIASDYLYYTEGASTFFIAFNPNKEALEEMQTQAGAGKNKTIMSVLEFRQALSFAVDRVQFCLACDPTGKPSKSVFNNLIISDPENGTAYRTNEEAKDVVLNFWGLADEVGEGKRYATKDEAIASITGVDLAQAKEKFDEAYTKAVEAGLLKATDTVELKIGLPNGTSEFYTKGYDYLVNCWTKAVEGTALEGKLTFTKDDTLGNGFADALRGNQVDILFGVGWQGSALDPYNLVTAYTDPDYQYDPSINYATVTEEIFFESITDAEGNVHENVTLVASIDAWANNALAGNVITANIKGTEQSIKLTAGTSTPLEIRTKILCAVEGAILEQYTMLPLDDEASAALKGMKINYYTEEYVYGVGRGGIKYMTYNYDDYDWYEFVKDNKGVLNYK